MGYPVATGIDAAMVGIGGLEGVEASGRIGEEGLDLAQHRRAVGLEREEVVAALREDHRGGARLGVDRVAGDQHAVERQALQHRPGGQDIVLPLGHRPLGDHYPRPAAEGGDDVQGRAAGRPVEGPAQRLAVDGEHPVAPGAEVIEEGLEDTAEGGRIEQAEDSAERVVARQPILQAQEFAEQRLTVIGELREVHTTLRAADRRHQRDRRNVQQPVAGCRAVDGNLRALNQRSTLGSSFWSPGKCKSSEREAPFFKCNLPGARRSAGRRVRIAIPRRFAGGGPFLRRGVAGWRGGRQARGAAHRS